MTIDEHSTDHQNLRFWDFPGLLKPGSGNLLGGQAVLRKDKPDVLMIVRCWEIRAASDVEH